MDNQRVTVLGGSDVAGTPGANLDLHGYVSAAAALLATNVRTCRTADTDSFSSASRFDRMPDAVELPGAVGLAREVATL